VLQPDLPQSPLKSLPHHLAELDPKLAQNLPKTCPKLAKNLTTCPLLRCSSHNAKLCFFAILPAILV
jgi:hypothetical protein